ncbi:MAG: hypothetical protein D6732_14460 [Methanobacteriota archaeon]|nr:MAG: hypothetical protein D6732_14460 [Euryarchaeota archaeon]
MINLDTVYTTSGTGNLYADSFQFPLTRRSKSKDNENFKDYPSIIQSILEKRVASSEVRSKSNMPAALAFLHSDTSNEDHMEIFAWSEDDDNLEVKGKKAEEFLRKLENPDPEMKKRRIKFWQEIISD